MQNPDPFVSILWSKEWHELLRADDQWRVHQWNMPLPFLIPTPLDQQLPIEPCVPPSSHDVPAEPH